jgi:hypothetical protein
MSGGQTNTIVINKSTTSYKLSFTAEVEPHFGLSWRYQYKYKYEARRSETVLQNLKDPILLNICTHSNFKDT